MTRLFAQRLGIVLLVIGSGIILSANLLLQDTPTTTLVVFGLLSLSMLTLAAGQIILIWHYRYQLRNPAVVIIILLLFSGGLFVVGQKDWITNENPFIANLVLLIMSWVLVGMLTISFVLGIYFFQRDHALGWLAVILLIAVYGIAMYVTRNTADLLLQRVFLNDTGIVFSSAICLAFWLVPLTAITFIYHSLRLLHHEFIRRN